MEVKSGTPGCNINPPPCGRGEKEGKEKEKGKNRWCKLAR